MSYYSWVMLSISLWLSFFSYTMNRVRQANIKCFIVLLRIFKVMYAINMGKSLEAIFGSFPISKPLVATMDYWLVVDWVKFSNFKTTLQKFKKCHCFYRQLYILKILRPWAFLWDYTLLKSDTHVDTYFFWTFYILKSQTRLHFAHFLCGYYCGVRKRESTCKCLEFWGHISCLVISPTKSYLHVSPSSNSNN